MGTPPSSTSGTRRPTQRPCSRFGAGRAHWSVVPPAGGGAPAAAHSRIVRSRLWQRSGIALDRMYLLECIPTCLRPRCILGGRAGVHNACRLRRSLLWCLRAPIDRAPRLERQGGAVKVRDPEIGLLLSARRADAAPAHRGRRERGPAHWSLPRAAPACAVAWQLCGAYSPPPGARQR